MKSTIHNLIRRMGTIAAICCTVPLCAYAFSVDRYSTMSKLAQGKWVKISVASDGIYEITDSELRAMGFSNPQNVQVFGSGGHAINEYLDGSAMDDLTQVSVGHYNGKLCFYGQGPREMVITDPTTTTPHYTHTNNTYSTVGCYFLTENATQKNIDTQAAGSRGSIERLTSLGYFLHENEKFNYGYSGKTFLGESIEKSGIKIDYSLPGIADSTIVVNVSAAANCDGTSYVETDVVAGGVTTPVAYTLSKSKVTAVSLSSSLLYYNMASPFAAVNTHGIFPQGQLNIRVNCPLKTVNFANLDYCVITYNQHNAIVDNESNQLLMGISKLTANDCIMLPGATSSTVVWRVDRPTALVQYNTSMSSNGQGYEFSPHISMASAMFIAFDPSKTLKKISGYEPVSNQNLHAMPVPDMLIITNKYFMPQAERIADLHKTVDGMDVAVVDQEEIFNEFSSGTRDAMAYRLLCKMLYDRNKTKFKYLLLFGHGSYDNRGLCSKKNNLLLTYQSLNSNNQDNTYTSDDFFGLLDDKSGRQTTLLSDILRIGVGRYPVANIDEARDDVDKLYKYVNEPNYGPWRNNALIIADDGDNDIHEFQAEGISEILRDLKTTNININKVYIDMFQHAGGDNSMSLDARRRMSEYLQSGQFFVSYIGHGSPTSITHSQLWTSQLAQTTNYAHLPIMSTAACETARFDSDERGISEHMFHKKDGGAIALVCATRVTLADQNDILNKAFVKRLFAESTDGSPVTLGDVYMQAKQSFGSGYNGNKMAYMLLGDPALRIQYPKPLFRVTSVTSNGEQNDGNVTTGPLQQLNITAEVLNSDNTTVNTNYNGDVTITLYDAQRLLKTTTQATLFETITRDIYYPRDILVNVNGHVTNGIFQGSVVVPRFEKANNEQIELRVYAHNEGGDMVNGNYDSITLGQYDESLAVVDNNSPVIESMYLNSAESFVDGDVAPSCSMLHIKASDDVAINTQNASLGNNMKLLLDGGKQNYYLVKEHALTSNDGHNVEIDYPIEGLTNGPHTLSFTVFDVAGNSASRTISFEIKPNKQLEILAQDKPVTDQVTFELRNSNFTSKTDISLKVVNAQGNIVWSATPSTFPLTWDLTDKDGQKVKPGLYRYYSNYNDGMDYGSTAAKDIIVIAPIATN